MQYLPNYAAWSAGDYLFYAAFGLCGALARIANSNSPVRLPRFTRRGLELNALGLVILGVIAGMLTDHNPMLAVIVAMGAPEIVDGVTKLALAVGKSIAEFEFSVKDVLD